MHPGVKETFSNKYLKLLSFDKLFKLQKRTGVQLFSLPNEFIKPVLFRALNVRKKIKKNNRLSQMNALL